MVKMRKSKGAVPKLVDWNKEIPKDLNREAQILMNVELGRIPVVPFELKLARVALSNLKEKQTALGQDLGEAMRQSSETWHDNAPAEVIANDSNSLSQLADSLNFIINNAVLFEYETNPEVGATLGSLVRIHYHEFGDKVNFILAGSQQQLTPDYMEKLAEYYPGEPVEMFSVSSPIGRYVLGKFADETFDFNYGNGEKTKITVESVRHINL